MGDEAFNESILTEKLSKLNSSQQTLSRWCVSHRKKAKQVVETWETLFNSAPRGQQISLLYLANDILQNSRRKGSEFVNEFWKVLPTALKHVYDSGEENYRKVANRLVDIWLERKVFGSRGQNLKNVMLGQNPPPPKNSPTKNPSSSINGKNANPIKLLKRDNNSLRIKLAVGGLPEKILSAFHLVHDEIADEEVTLEKCRTAVSCVQEIEKEFAIQGSQLGPDAVDNIHQQENTLEQCISQLEKFEGNRAALASQLREAIQDQESKLELIQSELLVAQGQIERAANVRIKLTSTFSAPSTNQVLPEPTFPPPAQPPTNPAARTLSTTTLNPSISDEESKRAVAAAVAAKLTASTSSAEMLTSVLSSLVAEEVASMSNSSFKRPKLEKPAPFSDTRTSDGSANSNYFPTTQQAAAQSSTQALSQMNQLQAPFVLPPPLPLGAPSSSSPATQFPYGYAAGNLPPPPLLYRPPPQQYNPVGIGFYGQNHQAPVQRQ
ncbi:uncharacterized protein LOC127256686 isoform X2 [Andrographis paniculata]|uniref:uncharacterized protein LOC127256686 isoform X2 n=1 Tax=Andrographis paniculata TaxID=175694 RepID=UPI0021E822EF|nr:uncharacterized protein LOC127256686 isoform X2 [Andrographis paniculata]